MNVMIATLLVTCSGPGGEIDTKITFQLDKKEYAQDETITGTVKARLSWPKDSPRKGKETILLNETSIRLGSQGPAGLWLAKQEFRPPLPTEFIVNRIYSFTFKITPGGLNRKGEARGKDRIPFLPTGSRDVSISIASRWNPWGAGWHHDAYGSWSSVTAPITITGPKSEMASEADLLRAIKTALPKAADRLFRYCSGMEYNTTLDALYQAANDSPTLHHENRIVWLKCAAGKSFTLTVEPHQNMCVIQHGWGGAIEAVKGKETFSWTAPDEMGVHKIRCVIHKGTFGWLLIEKPEQDK